MTILGHDVNGRPLRAGDRVVILEGTTTGVECLVVGRAMIFAEADVEVSPAGVPNYSIEAQGRYLRRLDDRTDHQPSDFTFESLMDHLKSGVPA